MNAPQYKALSYTVPAGDSVTVHIQSDFVVCLEASAMFRVSFGGAPLTDFEKGLTFDAESQIDQVRIENPNGTALEVTLGFGRGGIKDSRFTVAGTVPTDPLSPDTLTTGAATSCATGATTALLAADANRREAILVNTGAGTVYIGGDAGAAAGEGLPLTAGQSLVLTTSAAIYCRNDTGAAINVAAASVGVT